MFPLPRSWEGSQGRANYLLGSDCYSFPSRGAGRGVRGGLIISLGVIVILSPPAELGGESGEGI